ncbi:MAG: sugar kinase [Clostridia bacterium]|nr:sugar kinase [Clostridia bacterium]
MNANKIVALGELLLRLQPEGHLRFLQADRLESTFGGAEANVCVSLAHFGERPVFVTKLPEHEIGQAAVNSLRRYGVDVSEIRRGGNRVGIYYCEKGASQRPSKVIYDRAGSSFAESDPDEFDWETILEGASWFHVTGITPALSDGCAETALRACRTAREMGIPVSTDLNYRKKLWTPEKAGRVMEELCGYVDVCIANEEDAKDVFGIAAEGSDVTGGDLKRDGYAEVARKLTERFGFRAVAITLRESLSASDNRWSGMLYTDGRPFFSKTYDVHIVDRVGGGDSFGAGLIYAMTNGYSPEKAIEFAAAASCLKHTVEGDFNMVSLQEVLRLAAGDGSGRVQR